MITIRSCRDAAIFLSILLSFSGVVSFVRYFSFSKINRITSLPQCSNRKIPVMMSNNEDNILVAQVRQTVKPGNKIHYIVVPQVLFNFFQLTRIHCSN
jgi:hypothetical protein